MPGFLLHVGAVVECSHGGTAEPMVPYPRVTVSGMPIVLQTSPYAIAGCPLVPPAEVPCLTATWVTAATRISAEGVPVLLELGESICEPNNTPLIVVETQTRASGL
jgi:hypothetical protein